ncbi:MAG: glycoside hydrolase family 2 [Planctomycetes bacterium]|nr:glycoside hydrolase family 2 [Planctomycetota bacterium]
MKNAAAIALFSVVTVLGAGAFGAPPWQPVRGHIMTRWAKDVSPENVLPEYPRPQMVRKDWLNLNGPWDYAIRPKDESRPERWDGEILVPYPVESALSGVMKPVGPDKRLWYRRVFSVPAGWTGRVLLHFDAVDWDATVYVNGRLAGRHRGGYDPFTLDVTDALKAGGEQEVVVSVWDPTDKGYQPRGKQVLRPHGIWYTAVTGIWRTVWLESVPRTYIAGLKLVPDVDAATLTVTAAVDGPANGLRLSAAALDGGREVARADGPAGGPVTLKLPHPKLWSPATPFLYDLKVELLKDGRCVDSVSSYFGMRKISLGRDEAGLLRLMINDKFVFQYGPLDQGWWPDGLYTAPTDEALRNDVLMTKKFGMNMIRKHVKVEPPRWYYWCDKLGIVVWQDMPSGSCRGAEAVANYDRELKRIIDAYRNHPSIIIWVPFNEGWGQHDTQRIVAWIKKYDPTRLVDEASGWADKGCGDVKDIHRYPGPACPKPEDGRALVLGEFGGLGLALPGHLWWNKRNWGYRTFPNRDALADAYRSLIRRLHPMIGQGLSAAVYTQTTDCEGEVNGLMTYDRAIVKIGAERLAKINAVLHQPAPIVETVVPTSRAKRQAWRYTTQMPPAGWEKPAFDDSSWKRGAGGFGTAQTPGAVVGTKWSTPDIWIRRTFELAEVSGDLCLLIHHDEDAEVYVNGVLVSKLPGYTRDYVTIPLGEAGRAALKTGRNVIAVHCHQTTGGQFIDVGLAVERPAETTGRGRSK